MSEWIRLPHDPELALIYWRKDFPDATWMAVSQELGKRTWRWVHYGPTRYHVRGAALGLRSVVAAKKDADRHMSQPAQQAELYRDHPTEGL